MIWGRLKKASKRQINEFNAEVSKEKLSGKDVFAIISSAFLVLVIPVALVLGLLVFFVLLIFGLI